MSAVIQPRALSLREKGVLSAADTKAVVWPLIRGFTGGTDLRSVEQQAAGEVAGDLDRMAGIDCYIWSSGRTLRGVASRCQWQYTPLPDNPGEWDGPRWAAYPPNNFTIRTRTAAGNTYTELAKRVEALNEGSLMPLLTVQAYLERPGGPVQSIGIVPTVDLYRFITYCQDRGRVFDGHTNDDGSSFIKVYWYQLETCCRIYAHTEWDGEEGVPDAQGGLF